MVEFLVVVICIAFIAFYINGWLIIKRDKTSMFFGAAPSPPPFPVKDYKNLMKDIEDEL